MTAEAVSTWDLVCQQRTDQSTVYQIIGFDRPRFVGDVANAVPQNDHCRITGLSFEADGVRVDGRLVVRVADERYRLLIDRQLRSVRGLVSVKQTT